MTTLFVLGAPDPEMEEIQNVTTVAQDVIIAHAAVGGTRVHPGNAYKSTDMMIVSGRQHFNEVDRTVAVECGGPLFSDLPGKTRTLIDHHRPGDTGYGKPPAEYMSASSLGQVLNLLGLQPTPKQRLVAAADHCLAAAYRGECPGVDPDDLMAWRAESRATFQKRSVQDVLNDVRRAMDILRNPPAVLRCPEVFVADLRGQHVPELPEAAARLGRPFLSSVIEKDGREKVVLQAAPDHVVRAFLNGEIVPGLTDTYGDPARGFAGGYLP